MIILNILIILSLLILAIQDLKDREIDWLLPVLLLAAFILQGLLASPFRVYLRACSINLLFLCLQFVLVYFYYCLKGIGPKLIVNTTIGNGDLALLFVLCFAFSSFNFIVFYFSSLVIIFIFWVLYKLLSGNNNNLIPLAGLISVCLIIIILFDSFSALFAVNDDSFIIQLIYG